jgi:hypothetical protein
VTNTAASASANSSSVTRALSGTRAPLACASQSQPTSISSVQVNCNAWPPPHHRISQ